MIIYLLIPVVKISKTILTTPNRITNFTAGIFYGAGETLIQPTELDEGAISPVVEETKLSFVRKSVAILSLAWTKTQQLNVIGVIKYACPNLWV